MTFPKDFCLARLANLDAEEIEYRKHLGKPGVEEMLHQIRKSREFWLTQLEIYRGELDAANSQGKESDEQDD